MATLKDLFARSRVPAEERVSRGTDGNSLSAEGLENVVGAAGAVHNRPIFPNAGSGVFMKKV